MANENESSYRSVIACVLGDKGGCRKTSFAANLADYWAIRLHGAPYAEATSQTPAGPKLIELDMRMSRHLNRIHPSADVLEMYSRDESTGAVGLSSCSLEVLLDFAKANPRILLDCGDGVGRLLLMWLGNGAKDVFERCNVRFVFFFLVVDGLDTTAEFAEFVTKAVADWPNVQCVIVHCPDAGGAPGMPSLGEPASQPVIGTKVVGMVTFPWLPKNIQRFIYEGNSTLTRAMADGSGLHIFSWSWVNACRTTLWRGLDAVSHSFLNP